MDLVGAIMPPPPVASEDTTSTGEEANEERDEGAESQPVGVTVLSTDPVVPEDAPRYSPDHHIDNPGDEGTDESKARDKGHKYGPRTMVSGPAKAKYNGEAGKASSDWMENKGVGQIMDEIRREPSIVETPELRWKLVTDAGARTRVTEHAKTDSACPRACIEEINGFPGWR